MAYKFQLDDAIMSGTLVQEGATEVVGNLTATGGVISGSSLTLGSAAFSVSAAGAIAGATSIDGSGDLTMATITMTGFSVDADGDTVGKTLSASAGVSAGAASTFAGGVNLQSSGVTNAGAIAGATTVSGSGLFSAHGGLNAGNSNFTVSNAGAVVAASLNNSSGGITNAGSIAGATTISGSGALSIGAGATLAGALNLQVGGITNAGSIAGATSIDGSGDLTVGTITMTGFSVDADGDTSAKSLISTSTISGSGALTALSLEAYGLDAKSAGISNAGAIAGATTITGSGLLTMNDISVTSTTFLGGTITMSGASDHAVAVASDSVLFVDSATGKVRRDTFADYAAALVNSEPGFASAGGKIQFDPNSCTAADVAVADDSIVFVDANDGNIPKKESIADLVSAMAGGGLTATNGVLSTDAGSVAVGGDGVTLSEGYNYFTGTVDATCTLPGSPSVGDVVVVKAGNTTAGQSITINCAGSHLIDGDATNIHLESPYAAVTLVYVVANDWRLV